MRLCDESPSVACWHCDACARAVGLCRAGELEALSKVIPMVEDALCAISSALTTRSSCALPLQMRDAREKLEYAARCLEHLEARLATPPPMWANEEERLNALMKSRREEFTAEHLEGEV